LIDRRLILPDLPGGLHLPVAQLEDDRVALVEVLAFVVRRGVEKRDDVLVIREHLVNLDAVGAAASPNSWANDANVAALPSYVPASGCSPGECHTTPSSKKVASVSMSPVVKAV
jgi:hypothetical protein